jgi:hypothetical protein
MQRWVVRVRVVGVAGQNRASNFHFVASCQARPFFLLFHLCFVLNFKPQHEHSDSLQHENGPRTFETVFFMSSLYELLLWPLILTRYTAMRLTLNIWRPGDRFFFVKEVGVAATRSHAHTHTYVCAALCSPLASWYLL